MRRNPAHCSKALADHRLVLLAGDRGGLGTRCLEVVGGEVTVSTVETATFVLFPIRRIISAEVSIMLKADSEHQYIHFMFHTKYLKSNFNSSSEHNYDKYI